MRITSSIFLCFAALLIAGCSLFGLSGGASDDVIDVERGEEFWLRIGQTATTPDGAMITFESLVGDSRCPEGARCFVAGWASVAVIPSEPNVRYRVPDTLAVDNPPSDIHDHIGPFYLLDLRPYPRADRPAPDSASYRAQFVIE